MGHKNLPINVKFTVGNAVTVYPLPELLCKFKKSVGVEFTVMANLNVNG